VPPNKCCVDGKKLILLFVVHKQQDKNNNTNYKYKAIFFFPLALQPQFGPRPTSMKLSVSLRFFLDLRQSVGLLGRVISSSQGLYLYTNTEKHTYTHKHPCCEWDSNPRSRLPTAISSISQHIGIGNIIKIKLMKHNATFDFTLHSTLFCMKRIITNPISADNN
jgi:hypothetical protein